jgi:hypothetical protein
MKHQCGRRGFAPQLVLGLLAMTVGLLLVLENFGMLQGRRLVRFWPVMLIGLGLFRMYHSVRERARPAGHVLMLVGVFLLLGNLGLITPRQGLALVLLVGGSVMALRATRPPRTEGLSALPVPGDDADLEVVTFMSYVTRGVGSQDFRGGHLTALMGACEIDLRRARIDGGEAVLNVFAFWGGIEIKVPPDWIVEARGTAVMGAFDDHSRHTGDAGQKLIITGLVIMGGLEVKN